MLVLHCLRGFFLFHHARRKDCGRSTNPASGFTLVELMITISIMAILASLAAPSFSKMIAENRLAGQSNEFLSALHLAKSEGIKRAKDVVVESTANDNFHGGWVVKQGTTVIRNADAFAGNTTVVKGTYASGTFTAATASSAKLTATFSSRGMTTATAFRICDSGNSSVGGRIISLGATGRISLETSSATCP